MLRASLKSFSRTSTSNAAPAQASRSELDADHVDELFHRPGRFLERRVFVRRQLDLDDLLEPTRTQLAWHADEQVLRAVLALQVDRAWQDLLLVEEDRFDHLDDRG